MTAGYQIAQVEGRMRDLESLNKKMLPIHTTEERKIFNNRAKEIKKLSHEVYALRKKYIKPRVFAERIRII